MTTTQKTLLAIAMILISLSYYFYNLQTSKETIKIQPIVIQSSIENAKKEVNTTMNHDVIFNKLEQAVEITKRAVSEEEIANNVLLALEKNVHKPLILETNTSNTIDDTLKINTPKEQKQEPAVITLIKLNKPKATNEQSPPTIVTTLKVAEERVQKKPQIVLVSQHSHAEITQKNTLIQDTHPEEKLVLYNGSKAYVLDESAETEEISSNEEEFENLPWSKTYGIVEESEHFELQEEI